MKRHLFNTVILVLLAGYRISVAGGGPWTEELGKGTVGIYVSAGSTIDYYNVEGKAKFFDTARTSFSMFTVGLRADYGISNRLELNMDIPFTTSSLTSKFRFPDRSLSTVSYYGIGATYRLTTGGFSSSIGTMLKLPPGFHQGIYDDPAYPSFLSDGFLQLTTIFSAGITIDSVRIKGHVGYNWRDEEPADEIPYGLEIQLSKVEGTGIYIACNGVVSTADVSQPLRPFYAGASGSEEEQSRIDGGRGVFRTIDRESYLTLQAGASVRLFNSITLNGYYSIRMFGTNSVNLSTTTFGVAYSF